MITITGFKWVPPFAQGQVRDLRARWVLEEVGLPYNMRLIDAPTQRTPEYRAEQPFGQVPIYEEDELVLFETGAILLHIAEKTGMLLPGQADDRARAICWLFAALNSVEPFCMNLAEVDFFLTDEAIKAERRPLVLTRLKQRLEQLEAALGDRKTLVDGFTIADLMMTTVLRILKHTDLLDAYPKLAAYRLRHESRPAFQRALEGQLAAFRDHGPADMRWS